MTRPQQATDLNSKILLGKGSGLKSTDGLYPPLCMANMSDFGKSALFILRRGCFQNVTVLMRISAILFNLACNDDIEKMSREAKHVFRSLQR